MFYLYQVFGLTVWMISSYYRYASLIIIMTIYSLWTEFWDIKNNYAKLKGLAHYETVIDVIRRGSDGHSRLKTITSSELVPGDIFKVPENQLLP